VFVCVSVYMFVRHCLVCMCVCLCVCDTSWGVSLGVHLRMCVCMCVYQCVCVCVYVCMPGMLWEQERMKHAQGKVHVNRSRTRTNEEFEL